MKPVWLTLLLAAGRGRALLVVAATAAVSGTAMVAASILRMGLSGDDLGDPRLWALIDEPGTRAGTAAATLLVAVPLLLLLDQAVRLGSSARERRWTALAVAGATRADRRRWGVVEVAVPAAVGGVLGVAVWLLLRLLLGTALAPWGWALVPLDTGPGPWAPVVVAVVALLGVLVGWRQGGREAATLPGAAPRRHRPRRWPLLLVLVGVALLLVSGTGGGGAVGLLAGVVVVAGLVGAGPWLTWRAARALAPRSTSPAVLLAVRRLEADPRTAGRAAAAVGGIALVGGALAQATWQVLGSEGVADDRGYYLGSSALLGVLAVLGALVVSATVALHSAETLVQRRREVAALVATGVPASVVTGSQRVEVLVATVPMAVAGSVVTGLGSSLVRSSPLWVGLGGVLVTVLVVVVVGMLTAAAVGRWVGDAASPDNLRTA